MHVWLPGWSREDAPSQTGFEIASTNLPDTALGVKDGTGTAIDPAEGEHPLEAPLASQDQQFLSRDPQGAGKVGDEPSPSILPPGDDTVATANAPAFGIAAGNQTVPAQIFGKPSQDQGNDPPPPTNVPSAPPAVADDKSNATAARPSADPAPMSDSETDPFAAAGSARFLPGKSDVQLGRKHKLVRPRLDLAAQAALLRLRTPIIIRLALELDAQGKVTHVEFVKHSGNDDIDQAIIVAAYQWWLEPSRDKTGKPIADVVPFVIRLD